MSRQVCISLMDPPFESERIATVFRLMSSMARRGMSLTVFAYEGAVALGAADDSRALPRYWIRALAALCDQYGGSLEWINCGMSADERGVEETVAPGRRGGPGELWSAAVCSDCTITIGTR